MERAGWLPSANGRPDGKLFQAQGDRFLSEEDTQKLDNHHGKLVRINKDGSVPADNPFACRATTKSTCPSQARTMAGRKSFRVKITVAEKSANASVARREWSSRSIAGFHRLHRLARPF